MDSKTIEETIEEVRRANSNSSAILILMLFNFIMILIALLIHNNIIKSEIQEIKIEIQNLKNNTNK